MGLMEGTLGPRPRKPFFENLNCHWVIAGFFIQDGDPPATCDGGPGYSFTDELVPGLRHDAAGTLQMANDGHDSSGSQYCLMVGAQQRLNYLHTVFGRVVRGFEVFPAIRQGDTMRVEILRLGDRAKAFRADDVALGELTVKARRYGGPTVPGPDSPCHGAKHSRLTLPIRTSGICRSDRSRSAHSPAPLPREAGIRGGSPCPKRWPKLSRPPEEQQSGSSPERKPLRNPKNR